MIRLGVQHCLLSSRVVRDEAFAIAKSTVSVESSRLGRFWKVFRTDVHDGKPHLGNRVDLLSSKKFHSQSCSNITATAESIPPYQCLGRRKLDSIRYLSNQRSANEEHPATSTQQNICRVALSRRIFYRKAKLGR